MPESQQNPARNPLSSLIADATRYARFTMKNSGGIAPIMLASTAQGLIFFCPESLGDGAAKDDFAAKGWLITASYGATAVVLMLESWITKAKPAEKLDTATPPSESYDREEVVVLIKQAPQGNITHLLPIHRLDNGKFWNLGDADDMPAESCRRSRWMGEQFLQHAIYFVSHDLLSVSECKDGRRQLVPVGRFSLKVEPSQGSSRFKAGASLPDQGQESSHRSQHRLSGTA